MTIKSTIVAVVVLLWILLLAHAVTVDEREALMELYTATNGPSWNTTNNGWGSPTRDVCTWIGVRCVDGLYVSQLFLNQSNLNGTLPDVFHRLPRIQKIWVLGNPLLSGTFPDSVINHTNLTGIYCQNCNLSGTLPGVWGPKMFQLLAYGNRFTGMLPATWNTVTTLQYIDVGFNQLTGTLPDAWGVMRQLRALVLRENRFSGTLPSSWGALKDVGGLVVNHPLDNVESLEFPAPQAATDTEQAPSAAASPSPASETTAPPPSQPEDAPTNHVVDRNNNKPPQLTAALVARTMQQALLHRRLLHHHHSHTTTTTTSRSTTSNHAEASFNVLQRDQVQSRPVTTVEDALKLSRELASSNPAYRELIRSLNRATLAATMKSWEAQLLDYATVSRIMATPCPMVKGPPPQFLKQIVHPVMATAKIDMTPQQ